MGDELQTVSGLKSNYTMMPINLGWCNEDTKTYYPRSVTVRFKQTSTGQEKTVTFKQKKYIQKSGNNPYYQWGRKDPIPGATAPYRDQITHVENKPWYVGDDVYGGDGDKDYPDEYKVVYENTVKAADVVKNYILHPLTFYGRVNEDEGEGAEEDKDELYRNLWDVNQSQKGNEVLNSTQTVKSIYDPCPVGYKIPPQDAFSGFTTNGEINGKWNVGSLGWDFSGEREEYPNFFPATGCRHYSTQLEDAGIGRKYLGRAMFMNYGYYWSAALFSTHSSYILRISEKYVNPQDLFDSFYGFAVRPIQE